MLGKLSPLSLSAIDYAIIYGHFVDTPVPLFKFRSDAKLFVDCGRQTGGRTTKTSFVAVGDLNADRFLRCIFISHDGAPFFYQPPEATIQLEGMIALSALSVKECHQS